MNKNSLIIQQASILMGALFFLMGSISAQESRDSSTIVIITDTIADEGFMHKQAMINKIDSLHRNDSMAKADISVKESKRKERYYSPKKATIYSAVLPGLGQVYNRKYWKLPIIYGGAIGLYYGFDFYNDAYNEARSLLIEEELKGSAKNEDWINVYKNAMDSRRKNRDYYIIGMGLLYVANIIDAMADAYFHSFDISDDLTLNIDPMIAPPPNLNMGGCAYGLTLSFNFR